MVPSNLIEATFQQVSQQPDTFTTNTDDRFFNSTNFPSSNKPTVFLQYKTDLVPILKVPTRTVQPNFVYVVPDESDPKGRTVYLELTPPPEIMYKTSPGSSQQMNVLGIVIFSATMGEQGGVDVLPIRNLLTSFIITC